MNKSLVIGSVFGAVLATAGGAVAGYRMLASPHSAEVVSVKPLEKTVRTPRQDCHDVEVTRTKPVKDTNRVVGTGLGAVVGGLLGNQIGGGNGRVLATVAGAAAGGYAGNQIQQKVQQGNTYTTTEQQCTTVYDTRVEPTGYEVLYRLNGQEGRVRMDHDPGKSLPVKDGHIITEGVASS